MNRYELVHRILKENPDINRKMLDKKYSYKYEEKRVASVDRHSQVNYYGYHLDRRNKILTIKGFRNVHKQDKEAHELYKRCVETGLSVSPNQSKKYYENRLRIHGGVSYEKSIKVPNITYTPDGRVARKTYGEPTGLRAPVTKKFIAIDYKGVNRVLEQEEYIQELHHGKTLNGYWKLGQDEW